MERLFADEELETLLADLAEQGWRLRLEQVEAGWSAKFRRVNGSVEEISQSGEPGPAVEAIRKAAAGTRDL